jgi:hypothetical protein
VWRVAAVDFIFALCAVFGGGAQAQGVEVLQLELSRAEGGLQLDFNLRPNLSRAVEDAMQRGIPLYFVAQAGVYRPRWYWRDERVARVSRNWRLSYQPLTGGWRVSLGELNQNVASAAEALALVSRAVRWRIAEADQIEAGERYYVEFSYRLDSSQLPRPMQLDLGAQSDWHLSLEKTLKLD